MRERIPDKNIWVIYAAILLLGVAYGLSISLLPLFLDRGGYSASSMGTLAVWFALGIVILSLPMGAVIQRLSARATLIACLLGYAAAVSAFPFASSYPIVAGIRFFDGAFSVGVWVSCETILLSRADARNKAFVTSLYAICLALGYMLGPLLARGVVAFAPMHLAFVISGAIAVLACLVVALCLDPDVRHAEHAPVEAGGGAPAAPPPGALAVLARIKTSCFATFSYGYFQASVVLLLPLYLMKEKGMAESDTILVPAFFAAGMLLFSNVAGRLGDRLGHLAVMRALGLVGLVMVLGFVFLRSFPVMCVAVFVAGASLASIAPVSLALQGVVTEPRSLSRANGLYNAFYATGMLIGPLVSSRVADAWGGSRMLFHLAGLWTAFVAFTVVFRRDDPAAALVRRG